MQVFLIAALSADGFIAPLTTTSSGVEQASARQAFTQPSTAWTSQQDQHFFHQRTKQAGVVVMGRRTFATIGRPLTGRLNIIYTSRSRQQLSDQYPKLQPYTAETWQPTSVKPKQLLTQLQDRGFEKVAICGGASIYSQFMQANLIDTLYLTIEPILFGQGTTLFNTELNTELSTTESVKQYQRLKLVSQQQLNQQGTIVLQYEVQSR